MSEINAYMNGYESNNNERRLKEIKENASRGLCYEDRKWLISEVERLNSKNEEYKNGFFGRFSARLLRKTKTLDNKVEKLEKALKFYADNENWIAVNTSLGFVPCAVEEDQGATAKHALEMEVKG